MVLIQDTCLTGHLQTVFSQEGKWRSKNFRFVPTFQRHPDSIALPAE